MLQAFRTWSRAAWRRSCARMEYVILKKLAYYREGRSERHLHDIRAMLRLSGDLLDEPALQAWLRTLGPEHEWALVASSEG